MILISHIQHHFNPKNGGFLLLKIPMYFYVKMTFIEEEILKLMILSSSLHMLVSSTGPLVHFENLNSY